MESRDEASHLRVEETIKECFNVFDHECNKSVDVREIGTIVRSLNCCPSESELNDILSEVEEDEPTGYIRYEKFLPVMLHIIMERKYQAANEVTLLKAFQVLDEESKDYLTSEEIQSLMTGEGEPFTPEEMEEMLSAAVDPDKGVVFYKDYTSLMVIGDDGF